MRPIWYIAAAVFIIVLLLIHTRTQQQEEFVPKLPTFDVKVYFRGKLVERYTDLPYEVSNVFNILSLYTGSKVITRRMVAHFTSFFKDYHRKDSRTRSKRFEEFMADVEKDLREEIRKFKRRDDSRAAELLRTGLRIMEQWKSLRRIGWTFNVSQNNLGGNDPCKQVQRDGTIKVLC